MVKGNFIELAVVRTRLGRYNFTDMYRQQVGIISHVVEGTIHNRTSLSTLLYTKEITINFCNAKILMRDMCVFLKMD